jgi:hypothetical protein
MAVYEIPAAALDAAEKAWHLRLDNGIITPPREHIEALLRAAAPYMVVVPGEVVPSAQPQTQQQAQPPIQTLDMFDMEIDGNLPS